MGRKEFRDLADPETVRSAIADLPIDPGVEDVPLESARDRVLAERVEADLDVPGFDRASMDGYAVRAADTFGADEADPARLSLVGAVHAGEAPTVSPAEGEAVEISTGAVLPRDATAVVPVERTDREGDDVLVRTAVAPGSSIMYAGADIAAGERALGPGRLLTAREIGLLAALGHESVTVRRRPRVGIVSTGDELVRPGGELEPGRGQIHDVNTYSVSSAVAAAGGEPVLTDHVGDDMAALEDTLRETAEVCDLVLSSGSTSASAVDVIYRVIEDTGELVLHGAAIKPGKPMLVGLVGETPFVGLPGYPTSAMLTFRAFVAPALRTAAGREEPPSATVRGTLVQDERFGEGRLRLVPVGLVEDGGGTMLVYPVGRGSGATRSLTEADGLVTVPAEIDVVPAGETVTVSLFSADVQVPPLLGAGEDDPVVTAALDAVAGGRYLAVGDRPARRRLTAGIPDIGVLAGEASIERHDVATTWRHEWGLVVPPGNPEDVEGLTDLVDGPVRLANRTADSWLRQALEKALEGLASERGVERDALERAIDGYGVTLRGSESPVRAVVRGDADAGLGLAATAEHFECAFVPLGIETVSVYVNEDRREKPGVMRLLEALERQSSSSTRETR